MAIIVLGTLAASIAFLGEISFLLVVLVLIAAYVWAVTDD